MSGNNDQTTGLTSQNERNSTRGRDCNDGWGNAKLDIFRLYIQENNTLEATMATIRRTHGIQTKTRRWKDKLKEWKYTKYVKNHAKQCIDAKRTKHVREHENTAFITPVTVKRNKTRQVVQSIAMPPKIPYHTPSPGSHRASPKESTRNPSIRSQVSSFCGSYASSTASRGPDGESLLHTEIDRPQLPLVPLPPMLLYMLGDVRPWSQHQLRDHNTVLENIKELFAKLNDLHISDKQSFSPNLCCLDNHFLLDSYSTIDTGKDEETSEVAVLDELLGLTVSVAESYIEHGGLAPETLRREFELAKAEEKNGYLREAEDRCKRILSDCSQIQVECLLGMMLATASRLEESTACLSRALSGFIIRFGDQSDELYAKLFKYIELLHIELLLRSDEQDWTLLSSYMSEMRDSIEKAISKGTLVQTSHQPFIYGFSFAYEYSVLGFIDPAKCMYRDLLKHSTLHLDDTFHANNKAMAHHAYGLLLRKDGEWKASAEQIFLACESAMYSGPHAIQLKTILETDFANILPYLAFESDQQETLVERIRERLNGIQHLSCSHIRNTLEGSQRSIINDFLLSEYSIPTAIGGFCPTAIEPAQRDEQTASTESSNTSISHKHGLVTYPSSEATGISNSIFMAA